MDNFYNESISKMENAGVQRDYIVGWAGGYLGNPDREEQRVNEAYEAGYNDGQEKNAENFNSWT
ncbi:MAG: Alvin_2107 family globule sulfur oxidation protein [Gammaproteobacteria bacterium]